MLLCVRRYHLFNGVIDEIGVLNPGTGLGIHWPVDGCRAGAIDPNTALRSPTRQRPHSTKPFPRFAFFAPSRLGFLPYFTNRPITAAIAVTIDVTSVTSQKWFRPTMTTYPSSMNGFSPRPPTKTRSPVPGVPFSVPVP